MSKELRMRDILVAENEKRLLSDDTDVKSLSMRDILEREQLKSIEKAKESMPKVTVAAPSTSVSTGSEFNEARALREDKYATKNDKATAEPAKVTAFDAVDDIIKSGAEAMKNPPVQTPSQFNPVKAEREDKYASATIKDAPVSENKPAYEAKPATVVDDSRKIENKAQREDKYATENIKGDNSGLFDKLYPDASDMQKRDYNFKRVYGENGEKLDALPDTPGNRALKLAAKYIVPSQMDVPELITAVERSDDDKNTAYLNKVKADKFYPYAQGLSYEELEEETKNRGKKYTNKEVEILNNEKYYRDYEIPFMLLDKEVQEKVISTGQYAMAETANNTAMAMAGAFADTSAIVLSATQTAHNTKKQDEMRQELIDLGYTAKQASEFLKIGERIYNDRLTTKKQENIENASGLELAGYNILSWFEPAVAWIGMTDLNSQNLLNKLGPYRPVDYNTINLLGTNMARTTTQTTADRINNPVGNFFYDAANMIADIGVASLYGPAANFFLSSSGALNETLSAHEAGASDVDAINYGNMVFASTYITESMFGGIGGFGTGFLDDIGASIFKGLRNPILRGGLKAVGTIGGEIVEEEIQYLLEVGAQKITYDPNATVNLGEMTYTGLLSAVVSLPGGTFKGIQGAKEAKMTKATYDTVQSIIDTANKATTPTEARQAMLFMDTTVKYANKVMSDYKKYPISTFAKMYGVSEEGAKALYNDAELMASLLTDAETVYAKEQYNIIYDNADGTIASEREKAAMFNIATLVRTGNKTAAMDAIAAEISSNEQAMDAIAALGSMPDEEKTKMITLLTERNNAWKSVSAIVDNDGADGITGLLEANYGEDGIKYAQAEPKTPDNSAVSASNNTSTSTGSEFNEGKAAREDARASDSVRGADKPVVNTSATVPASQFNPTKAEREDARATKDIRGTDNAVNDVVDNTSTDENKDLQNDTGSDIIETGNKTAGNYGNTSIAYTGNNTPIETRYKIVDASELIASNNTDGSVNANYPGELQPRDRTRVSSIKQINDIAKNIVPAKLGESANVSDGAPIVGSDNVVESGNGRTLALVEMYRTNPEGSKKYIDYIKSNAEAFGIDADNLPARPVLVRERVTDVDRVEFVRQANESTVSAMSATETAKTDAGRITGDILSLLVANDSGQINTAENRDFVNAVVNSVFAPSERGSVVGANGMLSANGLERITNAIFYKAYNDDSLAARLSESLDNDIKNATNVLLNIAPKVSLIHNAIAEGKLYNLDFSRDIADAAKLFSYLKQNGMTIDEYISQMSFTDEYSDIVKEFASILEQKNRGAKQATEFFTILLDSIVEYGDPNQVSFFAQDNVTKEEVVKNAIREFNSRDTGREHIHTKVLKDTYAPRSSETSRASEAFEQGEGPLDERADKGGDTVPRNRDADVSTEGTKELSQYEKMDRYGLTYDEQYAVMEYKGSASYLINNSLYSGIALTPEMSKLIDDLNSALDKMPIYNGTVYRNIGFDNKIKFDDFVKKHTDVSDVVYPAFTSASKTVDGYPVETEFKVHYAIKSENAKDTADIGLTEENEVIFKSGTKFNIIRTRLDGNTFYIICEEAVTNDITENNNNDRNGTGNIPGDQEQTVQRGSEEYDVGRSSVQRGSDGAARVSEEESGSIGNGSNKKALLDNGQYESEAGDNRISEGQVLPTDRNEKLSENERGGEAGELTASVMPDESMSVSELRDKLASGETYGKFTKAMADAFYKIAKAFGVDIIIDRADGGLGYDGYFDKANRAIHVNADAVKPLDIVLRHEVIHFFKSVSPLDFEVFAGLIKERYISLYGEEAYNKYVLDKREEYKTRTGEEISEETALEELCADEGMDMLARLDDVRKFVTKNRNVFKRFFDCIKRVLQRLGRALGIRGIESYSVSEAYTALSKAANGPAVSMDTRGRMVRNYSDVTFADSERGVRSTLPNEFDLTSFEAASRMLGIALDSIRDAERASYSALQSIREKDIGVAEKKAEYESVFDDNLKAEMDKRGAGEDTVDDNDFVYSFSGDASRDFRISFVGWINDGRPDRKVITVGTTSEALKSIGVKDQVITWDTSKINKIQRDHPGMSDRVFMQVPNILEKPIIVMQSRSVDSRVTIFGSLVDDNNKPVLAVLELLPNDKYSRDIVLDEIKVVNAYGKDSPYDLILNSEILYLDPNKKRTDNWLMRNRLQLPFGITNYGPIRSITYPEGNVNTQFMQNSEINSSSDDTIQNKYSFSNDYIPKGEKPARDVAVDNEGDLGYNVSDDTTKGGANGGEENNNIGRISRIPAESRNQRRGDSSNKQDLSGSDSEKEIQNRGRKQFENGQRSKADHTGLMAGDVARNATDVVHQRTEADSRRYAEAVENGNTELARSILDAYAVDNGYTPVNVYHGTLSDDVFTVFENKGAAHWVSTEFERSDGFSEGYYGSDPKAEQLFTSSNSGVYDLYVKRENTLDVGNIDIEISSFQQLFDFAEMIGFSKQEIKTVWNNRFEPGINEMWTMTITPEFADIARKHGFDSLSAIEDGNVRTYGILYPENIKSSKLVTYDDKGNIVPLDKRFDTGNNDIRYSFSNDYIFKAKENYINDVYNALSNGSRKVDGYSIFFYRDSQGGSDGATITIKDADGTKTKYRVDGGRYWTNEKLWRKAAKIIATLKYGANDYIPKGEKPARDIAVPAHDDKGGPVSRGIRTILEAEATPETYVSGVLREIREGNFSRQVITDKSALKRATDTMSKRSYISVFEELVGMSERGKMLDKYDIALLQTLYNESGEHIEFLTQSDSSGVTNIDKLLSALVNTGRVAGQNLQAQRMLKLMTPMGLLYNTKSLVDDINARITEELGEFVSDTNKRIVDDVKKKGRKKYNPKQKPLVINAELQKQLLDAKTLEDAQRINDAILADLGDQVLGTWLDKVRKWRFFAMLSGLRTHVRNMAGNLFNKIQIGIADTVSAVLQQTFIKDPQKRTKALVGFKRKNHERYKALRTYARELFGTYADYVKGDSNRYDMQTYANDAFENARHAFNTKLFRRLEKIMDFNSEMLEREDMLFLKPAFEKAFAKVAFARGYTVSDLTSGKVSAEEIKSMIDIATKAAQEATFREASKIATALNEFEKINAFTELTVGTIVPFKKTPINVLKTGTRYSPAGLILFCGKVVGQTHDRISGKRTSFDGVDLIDTASKGLVGTGVFLIGAFLGSLGLLTGGEDEDDKLEALEDAQGHQNYALEIGNFSITLDWMTPFSMPLFSGVAFNKAIEDEGLELDDVIPILSAMANPILETSLMNGVLDAIKVTQGTETPSEVVEALIDNLISSYGLSFFPQLIAAAAKTIDSVDSRTTADAGMSKFERFWRRQVANKLPFLRDINKPYTDRWGGYDKKDSPLDYIGSFLQNFVIPGYVSQISDTNTTAHLSDLYEKTGSTDFIPTYVKSFSVNKKTKKLTQDEIYEYQIRRGELWESVVTELMQDDTNSFDGKPYSECDSDRQAYIMCKLCELIEVICKYECDKRYNVSKKKHRAVIDEGSTTEAIIDYLKGTLDDYQPNLFERYPVVGNARNVTAAGKRRFFEE